MTEYSHSTHISKYPVGGTSNSYTPTNYGKNVNPLGFYNFNLTRNYRPKLNYDVRGY